MRGKRLARLLRIITLLRGPKSWNAPRLAEHLVTSRRNIHRDLALLELAGVPYYYDPDFGEGGGYRIRPDWFFPTVQLSQQECIDLAVLARGTETGEGIPLLDGACEVRNKLLATVLPEHQETIRTASELFDILSLRLADHSHCRQIMVSFQQALLTGKQIDGVYEGRTDSRGGRVHIQPRRVFLAGNCWYAACHENRSGATKLYRLARFKCATVSTRPITIEREFSLREFLGNAWTVHRGSRDWHVEIHFDSEAAALIREVRWHHTQQTTARADGSLIFRATVSGLEEIKYWVLTWGPQAIVLKPKELIDEVRRLIAETLRKYEKGDWLRQ